VAISARNGFSMIEIFSSVTAALPTPGHAEITAALTAEPTKVEHDRIARGVTALTAIEYRPPETAAAPRSALRLAAWNAERLKYGAASAGLLRSLDCDVVLLSESDIGMARSGNRHTTADLAAALDMGYAYGVEFVELGLGDDREQVWHKGERNRAGLHGNAILTRFPLRDLALIRLDTGGRWFKDQVNGGRTGAQRRLGGRMAIAGRITADGGDLVVVSVHLESDSDASDRAQQMGRLLHAINGCYGNARMVIGGDCNTVGLPEVDPARPEDARAWFHRCDAYEPLFGVMQKGRFGWRTANDMAPTQRMRPDGRPLPPFRRIDWLFTRGITASAPRTVAAVDDKGSAISDHDLVVAELAIG
jgi:endonuclease/exonuclease/phosphatase family metal-dependent hydrolase